MNKKLSIWIENNSLDVVEYIKGSDILDTPIGFMLEIKAVSKKLFDKSMNLLIYDQKDEDEYTQGIFDLVEKYNVEYFVYEFGSNFYYTKVGKSDLNIFRYIGQAFYQTKINSAFLGVHGRYERMNGTRDYSDWCTKAKFLGHQALGICEKGTLAGILQFQLACTKAKIKPIIGATIELQSRQGNRYELKVYVENEKGWINLLKINKYITIINDGYINDVEFYGYCSLGLTVVIVPSQFSINDETMRQVKRHCINKYVQVTTNRFKSDGKDRELLLALKTYFDEYMDGDQISIPPVLISDAYCLDYEDVHIKGKLNEAAKIFQASTENHYYRNHEELFSELEPLFKEDDDRLISIFKKSIKNTLTIADKCQFLIDLKSLHLPRYEMTKEEKKKFKSNEQLFEFLLDQRSKELIKSRKYSTKQINNRIATEVDVIKRGGFVDYFLVLWDIVRWCEQSNILVGVGRGSAGGSLVAYCLKITKLNPLDYDLLFERFLNEGRIESEFPDIDLDFNSERRDEVIQYMKDRYGEDFVCRVGTYTTLQVKGVIKELSKLVNAADSQTLNKITKYIDEENNESWTGIFIDAARKMPLKGFVNENSDVINDCRLALNSIKSSSQHACATIIVPKVEVEGSIKTIFEWIPMRKDDKGNLISEWEGEDLAKAGFLKEDILSTKQMNKINCMFDLIKQNHGTQLTLEEIPLDDPKVYELFCEGKCQDVFHFGSEGLTNYLKQLLPTDINDLIAAIALYRPGAMVAGAHVDYIRYKNGEAQPEYDYMLEEVTGETYSLLIYQEQIMRACQVLAGFNLVEADGIRKAMGKKIKELMDSYKARFIEGALKNGCPPDEANTIWDKLEVFSGYGFNKSHAAAYAITGYICNWIKVHYPMEFWTVTFDKADQEDLPGYVAEIKSLGDIQVVPVDINSSQQHFYADFENKKIFWSFDKIVQCGPSATQALIDIRNQGGKFFSLDEFCERAPKSVIKKPVVINLILSGAFDNVCQIDNIRDRLSIIQQYFKLRGEQLPEEFSHKSVKTLLFWELLQKDKSKLGSISYEKALSQSKSPMRDWQGYYCDADKFYNECKEKEFVLVAGIVTEVTPRMDKNGRTYCDIKISNGDQDILIRIFADIWLGQESGYEDWRPQLESSKGRILFITGIVSDWRNHRNLQTVMNGTGKKSKFEIF